MSEKKKKKTKTATKKAAAPTEKRRAGRPPTGTVSVTWRLPDWIADENLGDWTVMREVLDAWAEDPSKLDPELPEKCRTVTLRVDEKVNAKLEKEAERLSKSSNRKRTAGFVARRIYEAATAGTEEGDE